MNADSVRPQTARRETQWVKRPVVRPIAIVLLTLLMLEVVVRVGKTIFDDWSSSSAWVAHSPELGWKRRPLFKGFVTSSLRQFDGQGFFTVDTRQVAERSNDRIICLGDSSTFGWGVEVAATFAERLDRRLPAMDVINLAVLGYSSYQGLKVLEGQGLDLEPSIVVASFGHNDRVYVLHESEVDSTENFAAAYRTHLWQEVLKNVYLLQAINFGLRKLGLAQDAGWSGQLDLKTVRPRVSPESYQSNLVRMVEVTRERGIPLVFILLKDNPLSSSHLRDGVNALANRENALAIEHLSAAASLENTFSDVARLYLSRAYEEIGEYGRAASVRLPKRRVDPNSESRFLHLDTEYNDIMLRVAAEHSIPLVDAGSVLNEKIDVYSDNLHPNEEGHRMIAELLYEELAKCCLGDGAVDTNR